ncbi:MAG: ATP-binding protein, partial [Bacteroidota bacterium]
LHLINEATERAIQHQEGSTVEYRIFPRKGEMRWVKAATPIWLDNTRLLGVTLDITEIKEAEQSLQDLNENLAATNEELRVSQEELLSFQEQLQEKNRVLVEQRLLMVQGEEVAKLGAWILDPEDLRTEFTEGFTKVHGFEAAEVSPMNALHLCEDRIHPNDKERVVEVLRQLDQQALPFSLVYQFLIPGRTPIWLKDTVGHRLSDGRFVGTSQDITLQKEQELELLATKKELEQMIYSISHDLRAPIRHINGYSNMVLGEADGLEEGQRNRLERVVTASDRLGNLIDELLEYSRGRRKQFKPQEVNSQQLVGNLVQPYDLNGINWEVGNLPILQADPDLLERIFANLIDNAVKFTRKKEQANISISANWQEQEQAWVFLIEDNGAGFDMRFANKLFAVFQRLHLHDEFPGTGIGLATVQRFVQMHGGKIWAKGVVNEGAKFYFTIPQ